MHLTVIGCGYVGLVTGACLAAAGHEVFCTDIDEKRIDLLKAGKVPIYEEHLDEVLKRAAAEKKISYTSDAGEAIRAGEVIFICVGTPPKESGQADLSAIDHVARQIATEARTPKLVVEKSTVPALTGVQLQKALAAYSRNGQIRFEVASNPEFLREGTAVEDSSTLIASLLESKAKEAPPNCAKFISRFWKGNFIARCIRANVQVVKESCWSRRSTAPNLSNTLPIRS